MKKTNKTVYKTAITLVTGITLATLFQAGISFAENRDQDLKTGTIRIEQEESAYPGLAKISFEQAKDIALANVQGEVLKIELEDENGFLVYGVEIVTPEKTITDIKVDAGNGKILLIEKDPPDDSRDNDRDDKEDDEHEKND